ncbi:hypothetical protein GOB87_13445 [Acetobacter estunensis]|uniref:Uncharacterized protein n=1 Tax=Acetobacter estunensis TaxID=104097 RepID=A0A967EI66_9PROT|nr:flagellar hook-length control protein FliK [Acetobacter estunensis]NHO54937.1 hypothetical protein [Acetobacter estunensis]
MSFNVSSSTVPSPTTSVISGGGVLSTTSTVQPDEFLDSGSAATAVLSGASVVPLVSASSFPQPVLPHGQTTSSHSQTASSSTNNDDTFSSVVSGSGDAGLPQDLTLLAQFVPFAGASLTATSISSGEPPSPFTVQGGSTTVTTSSLDTGLAQSASVSGGATTTFGSLINSGATLTSSVTDASISANTTPEEMSGFLPLSGGFVTALNVQGDTLPQTASLSDGAAITSASSGGLTNSDAAPVVPVTTAAIEANATSKATSDATLLVGGYVMAPNAGSAMPPEKTASMKDVLPTGMTMTVNAATSSTPNTPTSLSTLQALQDQTAASSLPVSSDTQSAEEASSATTINSSNITVSSAISSLSQPLAGGNIFPLTSANISTSTAMNISSSGMAAISASSLSRSAASPETATGNPDTSTKFSQASRTVSSDELTTRTESAHTAKTTGNQSDEHNDSSHSSSHENEISTPTTPSASQITSPSSFTSLLEVSTPTSAIDTAAEVTSLSPAANLSSSASDSSTALSLTLQMGDDPASVQVTIDRSTDDSPLSIHIGTNALSTLNELQTHQHELVQTLENAGISTDGSQISFALTDASTGEFSNHTPQASVEQIINSASTSEASSDFANAFGGSLSNDSNSNGNWSGTAPQLTPTSTFSSASSDQEADMPVSLPVSHTTARSGSVNITA